MTCAGEGVPLRVLDPGGEDAALCATAAGSEGAGGIVEVDTTPVGPVAAGDRLFVDAGLARAHLGGGRRGDAVRRGAPRRLAQG